jgi:hypothetical protein
MPTPIEYSDANLRTSMSDAWAEFRSGIRDIRAMVYASMAAAPIALVATHGPFRVCGISYAIVYGLALLPTTNFYCFLVIDCLFVLAGRAPFLAINQYKNATNANPHFPHRRAVKLLRGYINFSFYIHPLTVLTRVMVLTALEARPECFEGWIEAARRAAEKDRDVEGVAAESPWVEPIVDSALRDQMHLAHV